MKSEIVVIVGYPKSGTSWLTRLVAELLGCPIKGEYRRWIKPKPSTEGSERKSNWLVFHSHDPFHLFQQDIQRGKIQPHRLIYIIRDVRDIAVSGWHYFQCPLVPPRRDILSRWIAYVPPLQLHTGLWKKLIGWNICRGGERTKIQPNEQGRMWGMIYTLDQGNLSLRWCCIPWDEHVRGYLHQDVLVLKYEDLLDTPEIESRKIVAYLGYQTDEARITTAIHQQSFAIVKAKFLKQGNIERANLLREGKKGGWREVLDEPQKVYLQCRFWALLTELGYQIEDYNSN